MIFTVKQTELFELLQSEKFVIGHKLFLTTKLLIEKTLNSSIKFITKDTLKQLISNFKILKTKWKRLTGGTRRAEFLEKIMKQNIILKIDKADFESTDQLSFESTQIVTDIDSTAKKISEETENTIQTKLVSKNKRSWVKSKIKTRRKMREEIQEHLSKTNNFLNEYGLCFKNIEICESSLHSYNNSFKLKNPSYKKIK